MTAPQLRPTGARRRNVPPPCRDKAARYVTRDPLILDMTEPKQSAAVISFKRPTRSTARRQKTRRKH